jgi:hypothetical protein
MSGAEDKALQKGCVRLADASKVFVSEAFPLWLSIHTGKFEAPVVANNKVICLRSKRWFLA